MSIGKIKLGIVGHGFVGSAVANGFNTDTVDIIVVDPAKFPTTLEQLLNENPDFIFVCVPTPENDDGSVNVSTVDLVLSGIEQGSYKGITVIKSTITPDHLTRFKKQYSLNMVYNPEFLTEANSFNDFINPQMQVLGGKWRDCDKVEKAYVRHSKVKTVPTYKVDLITASLIKYTINSWLATKVVFFNELHALHKESGAMSSWEQFIEILQGDVRVGKSHMQVPGPDGQFGFGGHCFPKDTKGLLNYSLKKNVSLTLLDNAVKENVHIRKNKKHRTRSNHIL